MTLKWKLANKRETTNKRKKSDLIGLSNGYNARGFLLVISERSAEKTSCSKNFLEINRYFALLSYCNTIGLSNNVFSIFGFSLAGKRRVHVWSFHSLADKTNSEHLPKPFLKVIRKSLYTDLTTSRRLTLRIARIGEQKQGEEGDWHDLTRHHL